MLDGRSTSDEYVYDFLSSNSIERHQVILMFLPIALAFSKKLFNIQFWSSQIDYGQHGRVARPALLVQPLPHLGQGGA